MDTTPAQLMIGQTYHERFEPFTHGFRYKLALMRVDLDRLNELNPLSRYFSYEKFNLYSFFSKDHGPRDGSSLRAWAETQFDDVGLDARGLRLELICSPRVLGYVFNPLSLYIARDDEGQARGIIYQVHNTFGEAHAYVTALEGTPPHHHSVHKRFHVSPFFDRQGQYHFVLRPDQNQIRLIIHKHKQAGKDFLASMALKAEVMSNASLLKHFIKMPFSTLKTIMAIHYEALFIWLKGAKYHSRPEPLSPQTRIENHINTLR